MNEQEKQRLDSLIEALDVEIAVTKSVADGVEEGHENKLIRAKALEAEVDAKTAS